MKLIDKMQMQKITKKPPKTNKDRKEQEGQCI